jgi:hypothetical protein
MFTSIDWYQVLWVSTLLFFNMFCLIGIFAGVWAIVVLSNINKATKLTYQSLNNKLAVMEESFSDWSWLAAPASAIVGGLFFGRNKKNKNSGLIKSIIRKFLD